MQGTQRFHLEGNFLPGRKFGPLEGNLEGNSIWKEIERKYCYKEGNEKEIYFIS
jgi:hypothetical protein